ncbi:peptidyl-dipeptidase Dcp [Parasediminibacterium sp. JCM 36343]|uniref:peptidyl-dipeptidase Dcp n=1 Tax=Parasediminibacterium sp. JCM 36343 TaxID=3374279 RepID=UPI00397C73A6
MKQFVLSFLVMSIISSSAFAQNKALPLSNPFSTASKLPYQVPDFSKIKDSDYQPALEEGIKQQLKEIGQIASNPAAPTFANTLVALEKSGQLLARVNNAFNLVTGANTNPVLQQLQEDIAPKLTALQDAIYLNTKLYKRVQAIYASKAKLNLDAESKKLLEYYNQQFLLAGAKLSDADKEKMKKLNEEEASLSAKFSNQLLAGAKAGALLVSDSNDLKGLSQTDLKVYAENAKAKGQPGKWLLPLKNTTQQPALQSISIRTTRQKLFEASLSRNEKSDSNDTRSIIIRIAAIRAQKAQLVGFPSYAAWKLQDQMAQTPEAVDQFFAKLVPAVTAKAKQEATDIQQLINGQMGGFTLQPYDWDFYSEQVRKAKYNLDESEIKPYFQLEKVLEKGVFYAANQLYGLTFKERHDIPVYQADVKVFDVMDENGKPFALFYCDYFKRDNKNGGAWMSNLVGQSTLLGTKPVIYNICNFSKPAPGQPAFISFDDVNTMFHEFGHALHGLFASQQYPSLSGTSVARDYVEFPSQFNEHWALDPKVLKNYALHYQTGQPIPQSLIDKIKKAGTFNNGYILTEAIAAACLDMQWHKLTATTVVTDASEFEKTALHTTGLDLPQVPPRYRSTYFLHIWANGYAAGYYAYQWTKMLEEDAFSWFQEHDGLSRANGQRFRNMILSRGNTEDYNTMFKNFRGHAPDIKAMQKELGIGN